MAPGQVSDVTIDHIKTHSGTVRRIGEQLKSAGDTGANVDLGVETFGIIGQAFSLGVRDSISETGSAISELAGTFDTVSDELNDCATEYKKTDDDNKVMFEIKD